VKLTRQRTAASQRNIERLRKLCLALPEATEKEAWSEPTWRVKGKLFAQVDDHHHGSAHCSLWLPASIEAQEALIAADPARFFRPPYVGHKGWIGLVLDGKPDWQAVAELVRAAYLRIAPPKLQAQLAEASAAATASASSRAPRGGGASRRRRGSRPRAARTTR
jgi:hypothetical protein